MGLTVREASILSQLRYFLIWGLGLIFFKKIFYLFNFREREREGEKHQGVVASHVPPTGDLAPNPGMCPDWELNWWLFGLQAGAQSTEPHQPGLLSHLLFLLPPLTPSPTDKTMPHTLPPPAVISSDFLQVLSYAWFLSLQSFIICLHCQWYLPVCPAKYKSVLTLLVMRSEGDEENTWSREGSGKEVSITFWWMNKKMRKKSLDSRYSGDSIHKGKDQDCTTGVDETLKYTGGISSISVWLKRKMSE